MSVAFLSTTKTICFYRLFFNRCILKSMIISFRVNLIEQSALQDLKEKIISSRTELLNEFKKFDVKDSGN